MTALSRASSLSTVARGATVTQAQPRRAIANYPTGTFLENIAESPFAALLIISFLDRTLLSWYGVEAPAPLAALVLHPVVVLARADSIVLSAHGSSFIEGTAFTQTNAHLVLSADGHVFRPVSASRALFLNGIVKVPPGTILAAGYLAGMIWQLDLVTGTIAEWLAAPLLATDPAATGQSPGANKLKIRDGWLYISNSSRPALYRVALDGANPTGAPQLFAVTGSIDDFIFLADGTIAAASHGAALIGIDTEGTVCTLLAAGCDGCTSGTSYGPSEELVVLTTGNQLEGGTDVVRIFVVPTK